MKDTQREWLAKRKADAKLAYTALMLFYPFTLDDLPGEIWRWIAGYHGLYQISNYGRIKSLQRKNSIILKPSVSRHGYLVVNLTKNYVTKIRPIHVLVAEAFLPNPQKLPEVNHSDGVKFNCHVSNLYWTTHGENMRHAAKMGLCKSGADHVKSKLNPE